MKFTTTCLSLLLAMLLAEVAWAQQAPGLPALRTRWRFSAPAPTQAVAGVHGSIALIGDREGNLCAVTLQDGKGQWTAKLPAAVSSAPGFGDNLAVVGDEEGTVHALSLTDGKLLWSQKTGGKIVGPPLIAGESVVVGSYDNSVHCLSLKTGDRKWSFATNAQVHAGVVPFAGLLITGGCDGHLRAIDPATGEEKWSLDAGGVIATTPVIADDRAIVATMEGVLLAVDAAGRVAWKTTPLKEASAFTATPAMVNGRIVFVADDGQVASVRIADGQEPATAKLQGSPGANLASYGEYALVGTDDGKIEIIDPVTARSVRRVTLGGSVRGLAVTKEMVVASTDDGAVWGLSQASP